MATDQGTHGGMGGHVCCFRQHVKGGWCYDTRRVPQGAQRARPGCPRSPPQAQPQRWAGRQSLQGGRGRAARVRPMHLMSWLSGRAAGAGLPAACTSLPLPQLTGHPEFAVVRHNGGGGDGPALGAGGAGAGHHQLGVKAPLAHHVVPGAVELGVEAGRGLEGVLQGAALVRHARLHRAGESLVGCGRGGEGAHSRAAVSEDGQGSACQHELPPPAMHFDLAARQRLLCASTNQAGAGSPHRHRRQTSPGRRRRARSGSSRCCRRGWLRRTRPAGRPPGPGPGWESA